MNGTRPIRGAALFLFLLHFSGARADGIAEHMQASEYQVSWDAEKEAYQAPNRAHGFRTYFQAQGILAVPREGLDASWQWGLTWVAYGRSEASWPVPAASVLSSRGRVDYRRDTLLEWYENTPAGLKQGFVLASPPEELLGGAAGDGRARGLVHLDLALTGQLSPVVSEDGQAIDFVTGDGTRVLRYASLKVTDARDHEVPSRMEAFVRGDMRIVRLVLDASEAVFPLTIDPLATSPVWTTPDLDQTSAALGASVATAGDFNGDGYSDILVGAPFYDNGDTNEGAVFFFRGSPSGPQAAGSYEGSQGGALAGSSVAPAGDVNGDGYGDVIVGVSGYDNPENSEGRAYLFLGSATGISLTPAWTFESNIVGTSCGSSVGGAGDVNGDNYGDVVIGCNTGARAYVFLGSPSGLAASPHQTFTGAAGSSLGSTVGTAGDVNGDGYADVLVVASGYANGQTAEGAAYVYHGSASGLPPSPSWTYESDHAGTNMISAGTAGDINGDGYADIVLGGSLYGASDEGRAFIFYGSATGLPPAPSVLDGAQIIGHYGNSVSSAGDIDGDGYADVLVAQEQYNNGQSSEGRGYLYRGGPGGLVTTPAWTFETNLMGFGTQMAVATGGDVNGDGYADVLLGFRNYANGQTGEGRAMLFLGSPRATSSLPAYTNESNQASAEFGRAMDTADVNGDGYADLLVGAPYFDAGEPDEGRVYAYLGSASGLPAVPDWMADGDQAEAYLGGAFRGIANAGDVNGDGYDDVVLGAGSYDAAFANGGRAILFPGSPTGLLPAPAWSVTGGQASAHLGIVVNTAGDVNGDGYADVIVGAHGSGNAFVYHGSASGLSPTPSWTGSAHTGDVQFGLIVATAGDVNRDGFSDVLVSAPNVGVGGTPPPPPGPDRVYLYLGSPSGLSPTHAWMVEELSASLGTAIGTAGDVNGDGFTDIVLGSPFFGNGQTEEGRVQVYHGSPTGLASVPAWTVESNVSFSLLGYSARTAGDVNGDGYADVLAGAPGGALGTVNAYLYLGSATGLALTHAWPLGPFPPSSGFFGGAVAAGDVNGDGYADLVVGAPQDAAGQAEEGRAFLYYGSGQGRSVTPRQRAANGSRPIAYQGASEGPSFRLGVLGARVPFGRGRVRFYVEAKPLGTPFDGSVTVSTGGVDTGTSGTPIELPVAFLSPGTNYHWRLRIVPDASFFPLASASRWFTAPWRGWNESMLRTAAGTPAGRASGLILFKAGLGVTVNWAADSGCVPEDTYEIYEGTLGNFTSHAPVTCGTGSGHTWNFTPQAGDRYFLVVPRNATLQGSYGKLRDGSERPAGLSACLPQLIGCP